MHSSRRHPGLTRQNKEVKKERILHTAQELAQAEVRGDQKETLGVRQEAGPVEAEGSHEP